jgi:hypothetical protein
MTNLLFFSRRTYTLTNGKTTLENASLLVTKWRIVWPQSMTQIMLLWWKDVRDGGPQLDLVLHKQPTLELELEWQH